MCLLLICETKPDKQLLELGMSENGDGAGIAWRTKDEDGNPIVKWQKGFLGTKGVASMMEIISKEEAPYLIHFRWATIGEKSADLCHPFPIEKDALNFVHGQTPGEILAHNGHWSGWTTQFKGIVDHLQNKRVNLDPKKWSDTRAMATLYAHNRNDEWMNKVDEKVAVMGPEGPIKIFKRKAWEEIEPGILGSYNPYTRQRYTSYMGYDWTEDYTPARYAPGVTYRSQFYDKYEKRESPCKDKAQYGYVPCFEDETDEALAYEEYMFNRIDPDRKAAIEELVKAFLRDSGVKDPYEDEELQIT